MKKETVLICIGFVAFLYFIDAYGIQTYTKMIYKTISAPTYMVRPDEVDSGIGNTTYLKSNKECPIYFSKEPIVKPTFMCNDENGDGMISSKDKCIRCNSIYHAHK